MELRGQAALVTAEALALVAVALAPLPIPAQVPLLIVATVSLYLRRKTWAERCASDAVRWGAGAAMGAAALVVAVVVVAPVLEARTGGMIGWTRYGVVRGRPDALVTFAIIVAATAVASEAVLRGWVLERARDLAGPTRAGAAIAVSVTAIVEMAVAGGSGWSAVGAALFGIALSALYLGGGRSLVGPIAARVTFELGALVLEALRLVD